jgi:hypothetical protein
MATYWTASVASLDIEAVFSPERYSARHSVGIPVIGKSVPLSDIAALSKRTVNPANSATAQQEFVVLDTTHAVEGRIHFSGSPIKGRDVGSAKRPIEAGNVIVSRLRTYLRQVALIDTDLIERFGVPLVCSTEFYVLEPTDGTDIGFIVPFLLSQSVQQLFQGAQEGGHHPRIHHSTLMELRVPSALLEKRVHISQQVRQFIQQVRRGEDIFQESAKQTSVLCS